MKLTIDNLDGLGPVDYSAALDATRPLKIDRVLNAPSRCTGLLFLSDQATPARRGRVIVAADNGLLLFTGYLATESVTQYAGVGTTGPAYRIEFSAISDEWLLDKQSTSLLGPGLARPSSSVFTDLLTRTGGPRFTTAAGEGRSVGVFTPTQAQTWSANAADIAATTYAAYRAHDGTLSLAPAGYVTHALSDGDGTLQVASLKTAAVKELANDVTVSGAIEPAAYITEVFTGDGTTVLFELTELPFIPRHSANSKYLLNDSFNTGSFNPQLWKVSDPGSHLGFGSGGLRMSGGNGFDGATVLAALDPVEMGGGLLIEAGNLQLATASDGVLCGLYDGAIGRIDCFVGYNIRQDVAGTLATPLLNGVEVGTSYVIQPGHIYTLRIRLHCPEIQRILQTFYARVEGAVLAFGGALIPAEMQAVFELVDLGVSSNTPATILYDTASAGPLTDTPASCIFAAVDAVQIYGSMGYCRVTQTGSAWVTSTLPSGQTQTRLIGAAGEGVDCRIAATGKVTFFLGRIPVAGEAISVSYRGRQRSVARLEDAASVAREASGNAPGSAAWLGEVLRPAARSTSDCETAAQAILSFAAARDAAVAGTYVALNPHQKADIWPGDVLSLTTGANTETPETASLLVRSVSIVNSPNSPELLTFHVAFANDWAEGLGLKLSEAIAVDALLPQVALPGPAPVLDNLSQMTVVSVTGSAIQIDAGTAPPPGGGFEVRRRDGDFGPNIDQDLVLRVPVRGISIPREGQVEEYYIRMYDGSTPPVYSRFSSALFTHVPLA